MKLLSEISKLASVLQKDSIEKDLNKKETIFLILAKNVEKKPSPFRTVTNFQKN